MSVLRASVTAEAGGTNYVYNPSVALSVDGWVPSGPAEDEWETTLPAPSPVGVAGCGLATWHTNPSVEGIVIPGYNIVEGTVYTLSVYVYVPDDSPPVCIYVDGALSEPTTDDDVDTWTRLSLTFTAASDAPVMLVAPLGPTGTPEVIEDNDGSTCYFTGGMLEPGDVLDPYQTGGGQPGDPVQVLVDGSDSPVTANGLAAYVPTPGDRLLVQRVGNVVEVMQFLSRGTVPYLVQSDLDDLEATVDSNTDELSAHDDQITALNDGLLDTQSDLADYQASNDAAISAFQFGFDVLTGLGNAGVQQDFMFVGDDPTDSTVKLVPISPYVQAGIAAPDGPSFATAFDLYDTEDIGDITYADGTPPMTTFYTYFTSAGLEALPWNG